MFSKIPYYLIDFTVKVLTLNLLVIKRIISPYTDTKTVLDLGCGVGTFAPLFRKGGYLGIDINKESIEYARKKNPGYKFKVEDVTNFKLAEKFDTVLIIGVLHHISDEDVIKVLRCSSICLRKGGKIIAIEAIPPLFKWNLPGQFLRANDSGKFIRSTKEYKTLIEKKFKINTYRNVFGGFFDYAYIVASY